MKKKNNKKDKQNQPLNKDVQFEEMEKAEEFGVNDFALGFGIGVAAGVLAVVIT